MLGLLLALRAARSDVGRGGRGELEVPHLVDRPQVVGLCVTAALTAAVDASFPLVTRAVVDDLQAGVAPDILTTAKGLAGGFPIGAMLTTATVAASLVVGTHGSTFGGNPLGCAVALAALDIISDPQVLSGVGERHRWLREGLETLNERHGLFREVRGQGLLLGCELRPEFAGRARELLGAATDAGVLCLVAGPDVLRLAPSLIISRADVDEGLARLDQAMAAFKPA